MSRAPIRLAVFASGSGSNAEVLMRHFAASPWARVVVVVTNNPQAGVIERAARLGVPVEVIPKDGAMADPAPLLAILKQYEVGFIALAGYLKKIPPVLIHRYPRLIANIHPALLPKFGGKGMYGMHVHQAVLAAYKANNVAESGITIHYVDEHYDHGDVIFQSRVAIGPDWDAARLQQEVHHLEHQHYPRVLENIFRALGA